MSLVRAVGVSKILGGYPIIQKLDFELKPGKITAFLGPNGAGKTTTMKLLAGLLDPDEGEVWIDGHSMKREPEKAKAQIGYVPDRPYLYEKLTGREMLAFVLSLYVDQKYDRDEPTADRISKMLDRVGMAQQADRLIAQYSHGMKQRIAVACGLIHQPKILIIDEPMVGLDPHGYRMLDQRLREFRDSGGSVLLSTHTLHDAQNMADEWILIRKGQLISQLPEGKNLEQFYFENIQSDSVE